MVARAAATETALRTAAAQKREIESNLVPILEDQARDVERVAGLGQVNTLVMLDTLVRQHEASLKLIDARLQEALATVQLQEIAGPGAGTREESP
jgi:hypothetical protein